MWSILENVPYGVEKVCSAVLRWNVLKKSIRPKLRFKACVPWLILCGWSVHWCEWGVKVSTTVVPPSVSLLWLWAFALCAEVGFLGGTSGKEPSRQCRRQERGRLTPGSGRYPEGGRGTHSRILGRRTAQTEEAGGLQSTGSESQTRMKPLAHTRACWAHKDLKLSCLLLGLIPWWLSGIFLHPL